MKTRLQTTKSKATKGISDVVAFAFALTLALSLGCLVLLIN
jgi:hypothetical protein